MPSKGRVLQLQHYSLNDGNGIRTIIFFAGCPLRCKWCANPEGFSTKNHIMYDSTRCTACDECRAACPIGLAPDLNDEKVRRDCTGCGACVTVCLTGARRNSLYEITVEEAVSALEPQRIFFEQSGGGVTYSGGECTQQAKFLCDLSQTMYDLGISQTMETSGYFELDRIRPVLERVDLLFIDIKMMDRERHKYYTGVDNTLILKNIRTLGAEEKQIVIRIPLIMGVNGDDENVKNTAAFVKRYLPYPKIELLPYHEYGKDKYRQLGLVYENTGFRTPSAEELEKCENIIRSQGVEVVSYK